MDGLFHREKERVLMGSLDQSRKGSIDKPIIGLVDHINSLDRYYTTSSCSGRIIVFTEENSDDEIIKKKGCKWLLTSHETISYGQLMSSLSLDTLKDCEGYVYCKFEAFVLHVACKEITHAQQMLQCAVSSGFRNSGISVGKRGKIVTAVRSTHSLQVPLAYNGSVLVTNEYIDHVVKIANQKMSENFKRITKFFEELKKMQQLLLSCKPPPIKPVLKYDSVKDLKSTSIKEKNEEIDFECFSSLFDK